MIILDGLDELIESAFDINLFFRKIGDEINAKSELYIIITSRYGYPQITNPEYSNALLLLLWEFEYTEQLEWFEKYENYLQYKQNFENISQEVLLHLRLNKENLEKIHSSSDFAHIKELIKLPILLHMIVANDLEITEKLTRASLYKQVFDTLIQRKWDNSHSISIINKDEIRNFIQNIALLIYQASDEYIKHSMLSKHNNTNEFLEKINYKENNQFLQEILASFYFQKVRILNENDYGIKFLHNSFYEYMAAEKIWHSIKNFISIYGENDKLEYEKIFKYLYNLFAPKILSRSIIDYLKEIINQHDILLRKKVAGYLEKFFPYFLKKQFLYQFDSSKDEDTFAIERGINVFYGYWTILINLIDEKNYLSTKINELFISMIRYLIQRKYELDIEINSKNQDLKKCKLKELYLDNANLEGAVLSGAILTNATIINTNCSNAKLDDTDLSNIIFINTKLNKTDFTGAKLIKANLSEAELNNATLIGADMSYAIMKKTQLNGVDFSNVTLSHAKFIKNSLSGARFCNSIMEKVTLIKPRLNNNTEFNYANLTEAIIKGKIENAIFKNAKLIKADLKKTKLNYTSFDYADLTKANLKATQLKDTTFIEANLTETNLKNADLSDTNFIKANLLKTRNLTIEQLSKCKKLIDANMELELKSIMEKNYPELFIEESEDEEE